jgi:Na+/proline symporter
LIVVDDAGGFAAIPENLPEHAFRLVPENNSFAAWFEYLQVWFSSGLVSIGVVSLVQRAMASRNEQVAQNAFYIAGAGYLLLGLVPVTLGYIAATTMPGVEDPNAIIPLLAVEHMHPVVVAIFVGAVISAIMSTSDSILLGCGTIISVNLLPRIVKDPSEELRLSVARWSVPAVAAISLYAAFNTSTVISAIALSVSFGFSAMSFPYILSIWWPKANQTGGLSGIAAGIATYLILHFTTEGFPANFVAFWVSGLVTIVVSFATQAMDPPRSLTDSDGNTLGPKHRFGTLPLFRRVE